jgi:hypothetical protein
MGYPDRLPEDCRELRTVMQNELDNSADETRIIEGVLYPITEWVVTCETFDPWAAENFPDRDFIVDTD